MATGHSVDEERLISKGLYRLVSDIIGPEVKVKLRRESYKTTDWMANNKGRDTITESSGSMAEGFELETSDLDVMFWSRNTVVVENYSQVLKYQLHFNTALMIDYDYTSPGFALVKCFTCDDSNYEVKGTCLLNCGEYWVSSRKYMEFHLQLYRTASAHGPCQSGEIMGGEYDIAQCLKCVFWPQQATSAISRMRRCGWPAENVIQEIIEDGCLLVPVASKRPLFEAALDLEWRISFSLSEKRLIHSMNHCQFLCYGLWKIFLSEVLKKVDGIEDLLCSYFLKTVVFWEISKDPSSWTPSNFISKFHQTLRLLASLVNVGNCPNFFIPDNNMFFGKVYGKKQRKLMFYLRSFINEGCLCFLKCQSLQSIFLSMIENPLPDIPTDESVYIHVDALRTMTLRGICFCTEIVGDIKTSAHELVKMTSVNMDSEFSSLALVIRKRYLYQNIAERTLHEVILSTTDVNITRHRYLPFVINILQNVKTYLGHGELLLAKIFYLLGDYRKVIQAAGVVRSKLQNENIMYTWNISEERVIKIQFRDLTYPQIIEQYIASYYEIYAETSLIQLYQEINSVWESTGATIMSIPPLVLANFLLILSHHEMNEMIQMYDVLRELHALVHDDDNFHIKYKDRAISWEILGICQQLCGEYPAAYNSYINALNDKYNEFQSATIDRLNSLQYFEW